ncbi:hypothetical protein LTR09_002429 [Extremus antarcticus]|uniref:Phosphoglycerate mutase-like protein n=1 Tax=Extremus antarcticus TaxID=702011 RepID=A0AAJ0LVF2_9PEZI|nr:hypothetical protein LTR09_002429 [Extremus antarcticus]
MAPTSRLYLTRHAQAEHNVDLDYTIPDAPLTPLGRKQASSLAHTIPSHLQTRVDLLVSSPLKRTLQTTLLGWNPVVQRLGKENIICLPEAQECNDHPCDTGSSRQELEANPEFECLNLERLTEDWTIIAERAMKVRQFLREREEEEIVVVAHGDILRQITATVDGPGTYSWRNAEMRVYRFDSGSVESEDCWLTLEEVVEVTGGFAPTSTEMDIPGEEKGKVNGKI